MATSKTAVNGTIPSKLSSRYEIRQLTEKHIPWASAITIYSNVFCSPVWSVAYPEDKTARVYLCQDAGDYLIRHQISSGLSFGVFDTEYRFKNTESQATDGKLYWDQADLEADQEKLLSQMDFPLCSVALAYDGINAIDMKKLEPMMECLPLFGTAYHIIGNLDKRTPESWKPTKSHQVLMRNATATRADYEGQGLMKKLAHYLMRTAASQGFTGIQIEAFHDAVRHVWLYPPQPFTAEVICSFDTKTYEEDGEEGQKFHPFGKADQLLSRIFVTLKPRETI